MPVFYELLVPLKHSSNFRAQHNECSLQNSKKSPRFPLNFDFLFENKIEGQINEIKKNITFNFIINCHVTQSLAH
jgi:hypothetical protein